MDRPSQSDRLADLLETYAIIRAYAVPRAEQRCDVQDLLAEGLNLIFAKYGKAEITATRRAI